MSRVVIICATCSVAFFIVRPSQIQCAVPLTRLQLLIFISSAVKCSKPVQRIRPCICYFVSLAGMISHTLFRRIRASILQKKYITHRSQSTYAKWKDCIRCLFTALKWTMPRMSPDIWCIYLFIPILCLYFLQNPSSTCWYNTHINDPCHVRIIKIFNQL